MAEGGGSERDTQLDTTNYLILSSRVLHGMSVPYLHAIVQKLGPPAQVVFYFQEAFSVFPQTGQPAISIRAMSSSSTGPSPVGGSSETDASHHAPTERSCTYTSQNTTPMRRKGTDNAVLDRTSKNHTFLLYHFEAREAKKRKART